MAAIRTFTTTSSSFQSLPLETVQQIGLCARADDIRQREASSRPAKAGSSAQRSLRGHARRPSQYWRADSALSLLKVDSWLYEALLPVVWKVSLSIQHEMAVLHSPSFFATSYCLLLQSLDMADIPSNLRDGIADMLHVSHGRHVRQLQLRIALSPDEQGQGDQLHDPAAVSVALAVRLLTSCPLLHWLEVELVVARSGIYVCKLPSTLASAIAARSGTLLHYGVSCEGTTPSGAPSQLDEGLAAELVLSLPQVQSLTLHRVNYDLLQTAHSPLCDSLASLQHLRKLCLLEVDALDSRWTLSGSLEELTIVSCDRVTALDVLLDHIDALNTLTLVNSPLPLLRRRLPTIKTLHLECEEAPVALLEKLAAPPERLVLKYAPRIEAAALKAYLDKHPGIQLAIGEKGITGDVAILAGVVPSSRSSLVSSDMEL